MVAAVVGHVAVRSVEVVLGVLPVVVVVGHIVNAVEVALKSLLAAVVLQDVDLSVVHTARVVLQVLPIVIILSDRVEPPANAIHELPPIVVGDSPWPVESPSGRSRPSLRRPVRGPSWSLLPRPPMTMLRSLSLSFLSEVEGVPRCASGTVCSHSPLGLSPWRRSPFSARRGSPEPVAKHPELLGGIVVGVRLPEPIVRGRFRELVAPVAAEGEDVAPCALGIFPDEPREQSFRGFLRHRQS